MAGLAELADLLCAVDYVVDVCNEPDGRGGPLNDNDEETTSPAAPNDNDEEQRQ